MAEPNKKFRWALDSGVVIALIKGDEEIRGRPASVYSRGLFDRAERGEARIVVSTLCLVEVYKPHPKSSLQDPPKSLESMVRFFQQPFVDVIELDRITASLAQSLAAEDGIPSWDAVHLATAMKGRADCLYSWDFTDLILRSPVRGFVIREPPACALPGESLPDYQQSSILDS